MALHIEARDLATPEFHSMFGLRQRRPRAAAALIALDLAHIARWFSVGQRSVRRWRDGSRRTPRGARVVPRPGPTQGVRVAQVERPAVPAITSTSARTNGCAPPVKPPREAAAPLASLASPAQTNGGEPPAPLIEPAT